jgi:hypothetical protein
MQGHDAFGPKAIVVGNQDFHGQFLINRSL